MMFLLTFECFPCLIWLASNLCSLSDPFVSIDKKLSSPTNMQVNENSGAVHLRCAVEGYPRVLITWHKYDGNDDGRKKYTSKYLR